MNTKNIVLIIFCVLLTYCGESNDVKITKAMSTARTLLIAVDSYSKTHSNSPISLREAVEEFKSNISGDFSVDDWHYIPVDGSYVLIFRKNLENQVIMAYPPDVVRAITLDQ